MSKETRQELASLSFGEKLRILEKLRELSREIASFGLRKSPPAKEAASPEGEPAGLLHKLHSG